MSVVHKITGYDKKTEIITQEFCVPDDRIAEIRELARVDPRASEIVGAYPLEREAAVTIQERFNFGMWIDRCDWFFEPFST